MRRRWLGLAFLLLSGCASYDGYGLNPQHSRLDDVVRVMGQPSLRWQEADGAQTLVYPRGPVGLHTYFVRGDAAGRFVSRENVLTSTYCARIQPGMTQEQVVRILGPSVAAWTVYFEARDELVWEWRYCDDWHDTARFNVLFDGTTRLVRSTLSATERQRGLYTLGVRPTWCS